MSKDEIKSVAFFPSHMIDKGNPYWSMLAAGLETAGVEFVYETPQIFSYKWLFTNRKKIHVLHLHYCQGFYYWPRGKVSGLRLFSFVVKLLLCRVLGYRVIFTLHNLEPTYPLTPKWLDILGHFIAIQLAHRVIVHCHEAKRLMTKKYGRRRGVYIVDHPNYADIYPNKITKAEARLQLGMEGCDEIVFSFIGGIRPNKGIETLINAFQKIEDPDIRLVVAGSPLEPFTYAESLQELAQGDIRIRFDFLRIPDEKMQIYLNASDIVVLPFSRILTSGSALLAMSFGKPVILPRMGCMPELIGSDAGWLYEPGSIDSLAEVMRVAANRDFQKFGRIAQEKAKHNSPDHFVEQTMQAYWG